jgi:hypothetical protein
VYHSPIPRHIFLRCRKDTTCENSSIVLHGSGLLEGASSCHATTAGLHLRPVFHARTSFKGHMPSMADSTALYKTERKKHSTWFDWGFPRMSALVTIFGLYILYILLTPFHQLFCQNWHYCVRQKLPAKESAELRTTS